MATAGGSTVRRLLSRWGRSTAVDRPAENMGKAAAVAMTRLKSGKDKGRSYSETVKAGRKWKKEAMQSKQFSRQDIMMEMMAIDELDAQLLPIHQAAAEGDVDSVATILMSHPDAIFSADGRGATALHHATSESFIDVMEFLIKHGADLNAKDELGETSLHWAITFDKKDAVEFLLEHGASTSVKSGVWEAPLHTAVRLQNVEIVTILAGHVGIDLNIKGEHARTPLHVASLGENTEIADILLAHKALPCASDGNGLKPIHLASRQGKPHMVNHLIDYAVKYLNYPENLVVNFTNDDGMTGLHQAVSGGNVPVAILLLQRGCRLFNEDSKTESSFHLACSQGSLPMIQAILDHSQVPVKRILDAKDQTGQTPLHKAAIFNHTAVADFLVTKGADINASDKFGRTPLLLAAQAGSKSTMQYLLGKGADTERRDTNHRNFLHLAIMRQGQPIAESILRHAREIPRSLFDDQDALGLTPVHYASKAGYVGPLEQMLQMGASRNPKDNKRSTPLHFAAKYGRYNAAKRLIQGRSEIINEENRQGMTPLHVACHNGFHQLADLFLREGAVIHRCAGGCSPLHNAAIGGYIKCLSVLLASHRYVLNWKDHDGSTALHRAVRAGNPQVVKYLLSEGAEILVNKEGSSFLDLAIEEKQSKCALAAVEHQRWEEALSVVNRTSGYPMMRLIQELPEVAKIALDRCVQTSDLQKEDKQFWRKYNFKYLLCEATTDPEKDDEAEAENSGQGARPGHEQGKQKPVMAEIDIAELQEKDPLPGLSHMVQFDRRDLLHHPVANALLKSRWHSYGRMVFGMNIVFYVFYLVFLTSLITLIPLPVSLPNANRTMYKAANGTLTTDPKLSGYAAFCQYLVIAFAIANLVKEVSQVVQMRLKYLQDFTNYLELSLFITTLLFVIPLGSIRYLYQLELGAVCIFLAWMNFLLYLQRFEAIGIYIVMFVEVVKTLLVVLGVFFVLIVAFGLCFYVLLYPAEPSFTNVPKAFLNVFEVMLGEFSFEDFFSLQSTQGLRYPALTWIMLIVLLIFMPIIFMNLLIGLAVGDIDGVRKNAVLKRLAMQVEFHSSLESKLPARIKRSICHSECTDYPNRCKNMENVLSFAYQSLSGYGDQPKNPEMASMKEQMKKQKKRLKEISEKMDRQHHLLLALVEKMDLQVVNDTQWDDETSPVVQQEDEEQTATRL